MTRRDPRTLTLLLLFYCRCWFVTEALRCHQCGWDTCGNNEELIECSLERVNSVHANFERLTNIPQFRELQSADQFVCFELRLTNAHGNRTGTVKSCTLQRANLCGLTNWKMVKVLGCRTCNDEDYCNGFGTKLSSDTALAAISPGFSFSSSSSSSGGFDAVPSLWLTVPSIALLMACIRLE